MTIQPKTYQSTANGSAATASGAGAAGEGGASKSTTTHYAYRLLRDETGAVTGKEFLNGVFVDLQESKYNNPYLKMRVLEAIPAGDIYIAEKRKK